MSAFFLKIHSVDVSVFQKFSVARPLVAIHVSTLNCSSDVKTSDRVSRHVSRLETVSRHDYLSCLGLVSVSTLVCLVLARVSSFHVSSCLMSHDCVFTVSLSRIAESIRVFSGCLFTYCKTLFLVLVCFTAIMCLDNCTLAMSQSETFKQRLSLVSI